MPRPDLRQPDPKRPDLAVTESAVADLMRLGDVFAAGNTLIA